MENFIKVCLFSDDGLSMDFLGEASSEDIFGEPQEEKTPFDDLDEDDKEKADEAINPDDIFKEEDPQGNVGNEDDNEEKVEPTKSDKKDKGSSPKTTFYSSALKALKDDGVLPDLDDEFIK